MQLLSAWSSFYIMTGSSAAALTGLMFVVITITAGDRSGNRSSDGISTYSTPTVMHFCAAFLVSALLVAPWHSVVYPAIALGLGGLYGLIYVARITYRAAHLLGYTPDLEDRTWYSIVPFLAYGVIFGGAVALPMLAGKGLFAVGVGVVLLIFLGIRNAWDVVTFLAVRGGDAGGP